MSIQPVPRERRQHRHGVDCGVSQCHRSWRNRERDTICASRTQAPRITEQIVDIPVPQIMRKSSGDPACAPCAQPRSIHGDCGHPVHSSRGSDPEPERTVATTQVAIPGVAPPTR